jgi:hypothetical protein
MQTVQPFDAYFIKQGCDEEVRAKHAVNSSLGLKVMRNIRPNASAPHAPPPTLALALARVPSKSSTCTLAGLVAELHAERERPLKLAELAFERFVAEQKKWVAERQAAAATPASNASTAVAATAHAAIFNPPSVCDGSAWGKFKSVRSHHLPSAILPSAICLASVHPPTGVCARGER